MRLGFERLPPALAVALAGSLASGLAEAQDAVEGRVSGDVCLVAGAGASVASRGARAEGELRLRYLETAGMFAAYEDAVASRSSSEPHRVLSGGFEFRPLFLYRWLRGFETRHGYADLTIDSLGLELGAFLSAPSGAPTVFSPGFQLGLGIEVPLVPTATGLWLGVHGGIRWGDRALAVGSTRDPDDRSAYLTLTAAWHQVLRTHIVDVTDEAPR